MNNGKIFLFGIKKNVFGLINNKQMNLLMKLKMKKMKLINKMNNNYSKKIN